MCPPANFPSWNICSLRSVKVETVKSTSSAVLPLEDGLQPRPELRDLFLLAKDQRNPKFAPQQASIFRDPYLMFQQWYCQWLHLLREQFVTSLSEQEKDFTRSTEFQHFWSDVACDMGDHKLPISVAGFVMRDALGLNSPSRVAGRKVAQLLKGGLGIVSPATLPGDELHTICTLKQLYLLVLRPLDATVVVDTAEVYDGREEDGNPRRFRHIGYAWVEQDCAALRERPISESFLSERTNFRYRGKADQTALNNSWLY